MSYQHAAPEELLYLLHATACNNNKREREKHAAP